MGNSTDQHTTWLNEWRTAMDAEKSAPDNSTKEKDLFNTAEALSKLIATTPATTLEGMAAQLAWFKEDLGGYIFGNAAPEHDQIFDTLQNSAANIAR